MYSFESIEKVRNARRIQTFVDVRKNLTLYYYLMHSTQHKLIDTYLGAEYQLFFCLNKGHSTTTWTEFIP